MAKSTRRKYYKRKGRWSANIKTITDERINNIPSGSFYFTKDLCLNPAQSDATVSQQYTVKNIELSYELETIYAQGSDLHFDLEGLTAYIMYVPQGMTVTETYPNFHPEYIMAMRFLTSYNKHRGVTQKNYSHLKR